MRETEEKVTFVLDTSAILNGVSPHQWDDVCTVPEVLEEIKHGELHRILDFYGDLLKIVSPSVANVNKVKMEASSTGDLQKMSRADIAILALALETGGTLLSNDFCIQNVASSLGVKFQSVNARQITRRVAWRASCTGCGRDFDPDVKICPVCGHETRRRGKAISDV